MPSRQKNIMTDTEIRFELFKQHQLAPQAIKDEDWTEEMLWYAIEDGRTLQLAVTDVAIIPDSLVIKGLDKGYSSVFTEKIISTHPNITDEHYINFIRNADHTNNIFDPIRTFVTHCERLMTHDIILELALVTPTFIFMINSHDIKFTEDELLRIGDRYFERDYCDWFIDWRDDFPMSRHHWDCIINSKLNKEWGIPLYLVNRKDVPHDVFMEWCKHATPYELKDMKNVTAQNIIDCLATKDEQYARELLGDGRLGCIFDVLKLDPSLIQYVKAPAVKLCKSVIDIDPRNIRFINTKSENVYKYALKKDSSVKEFIPDPVPKKPEFSAPWYLCKFDCDVCDEDSACHFELIRGKDMDEFLAKKFTVSFGNLWDEKPRNVKDHVQYDPLTDEEYELVKRLDICSYTSGVYDFDPDKDEYDFDEESEE